MAENENRFLRHRFNRIWADPRYESTARFRLSEADAHCDSRLFVRRCQKTRHGKNPHRVFDKFDFENTYPNALTSTVPGSVKIPMVLKNDRQAIQACIKTCNRLDRENATVIRIKNTITLGEIEISENLIDQAEKNPSLEIVGSPVSLAFNADGNLF